MTLDELLIKLKQNCTIKIMEYDYDDDFIMNTLYEGLFKSEDLTFFEFYDELYKSGINDEMLMRKVRNFYMQMDCFNVPQLVVVLKQK